MRPKQILFGNEARQKLIAGVDKIGRAVTTTLSPKGRNVALGQPYGQTPKVIHDGVSVAKEIFLEDPFENMGALLAREAAEKTNDAVGDGTTTAILLTQALTIEGMKKVNNGVNPMLMKTGIDRAVVAVTAEIERLAKPLQHKDWEQVATISAQNALIGKKIVEALELVGDNGMIEVQEGKSTEITIEHKEGMTYDSGYVSPYFCKSPQELEAVIEKANLLITDGRLTEFSEFMPLLEKLIKVSPKADLVIIADSVEDEALNGMIVNKLQGRMNVIIVRAPYYGQKRRDMLEDIAVITGGKVISEAKGLKLSDSNVLDYIGHAELVKADKNTTSIIGGSGKQEAIDAHIERVKAEKAAATRPHEQESTAIRLAKLTGGVAVVMVGAGSESEMKNLKERVIDAKGATLAAIKSGIIAGGGVTLIQAVKVLETLKGENPDEQAGIDLVKEIAQEPLRLLATNAGKDAGYIVGQIIDRNDPEYGYNVMTGMFGNMIKMGIIEPALLAVSSLKYAASAASMILTTECLVNEIVEEKK